MALKSYHQGSPTFDLNQFDNSEASLKTGINESRSNNNLNHGLIMNNPNQTHKHQELNAIKNATNMLTQYLTLKPRSYQRIIYTGPFANFSHFLTSYHENVKRKNETATQDIKADHIPGKYKLYSDTH